MDKILLDNMSGQEIKELIDNGMINLKELQNSALEKVLNFEIDMLCYGTGDMDIIRQCSEIIDKRNKSDKLNQDEISNIINKTKSEHVTIVNADNNSPSVVAPQRKRRFVFKKAVLVAAIVSAMLVATLSVAAAFGVNIFEYLNQIVRQDSGSEIVVDNFTFYHNGEPKKYSSIEELIEKENLDIMYPTKLPDGVYIDKIRMSEGLNSEKEIHFITNDVDANIVIYVGYYYTLPSFNDVQIVEFNNRTFYIRNNKNFAFCYHKNNYYSIKAKNHEDLMTIIKNMKE